MVKIIIAAQRPERLNIGFKDSSLPGASSCAGYYLRIIIIIHAKGERFYCRRSADGSSRQRSGAQNQPAVGSIGKGEFVAIFTSFLVVIK